MDVTIIHDLDGRIIFLSRGAEDLFGYTVSETCDMKIMDLMADSQREKYLRDMGSFAKAGRSDLVGNISVLDAINKSGEHFLLRISVSARMSAGGWIFTALGSDNRSYDSWKAMATDEDLVLSDVNEELSVLYNVSKILSQSIDMDELLVNILKTVTRSNIMKGMHEVGAIFVKEGERLKLACQMNCPESFIDVHRHGVRLGDCLCGITARDGKMVVCKNSQTDERHTVKYKGMRQHGHIVVPLLLVEDVVGVMCLFLQPDVDIPERAIRLLSTIGSQAGIAVNNARLYEKTKTLALHDPLTGLANRRLLEIECERNLRRAKRYMSPLSFIMLDIDDFKLYNDMYGHLAGDRLLYDVARILIEIVREADLVVRYGGEEFLILLPEIDMLHAGRVAERIRMAINDKTRITVSMGLSSFREGMRHWKDILNEADIALYQAKKKGKNRVETISLLE